MSNEFYGILNLNKPSGITSRDAVDQVQRLLPRLPRRIRIGHAGTLDPLASGVLVICIGRATRLIQYVQRRSKNYRGEFLLGRTSPTEDTDGEVTELDSPPIPTLEELREAAARLVGQIQQRPPAFSALKVDGRRAYHLARAGKEVELTPRPIDIYRLEVLDYDYPRVTLDVACGSGTYIRALGRDLAESLGTGAVMSGLVRTAIGPFTLEKSITPNDLERETLAGTSLAERLLPAMIAVDGMPRLDLNKADSEEILHGRSIAIPEGLPEAEEYVAVTPEGQLEALLVVQENRFWPRRVFMSVND